MAGPAVARKGRAWSCNSRLKDGGLGMAWALGADEGSASPGLLVLGLGKTSVLSFATYPVPPTCGGRLEFTGPQNRAEVPVLVGVRAYPHPSLDHQEVWDPPPPPARTRAPSPHYRVSRRRACRCPCRSRCWRWPCPRPAPASSSSSWASSQGSWQPGSAASPRAPTAPASRRWPEPGWRWTASSRCRRRRDSSRPAWLPAPALRSSQAISTRGPQVAVAGGRPPPAAAGPRTSGGQASPSPAAPASAPLWTGEGSTQGSRRGAWQGRGLPAGPAGSCLGKPTAVQGGTWGHPLCVRECM